jgi:hypothetical protein
MPTLQPRSGAKVSAAPQPGQGVTRRQHPLPLASALGRRSVHERRLPGGGRQSAYRQLFSCLRQPLTCWPRPAPCCRAPAAGRRSRNVARDDPPGGGASSCSPCGGGDGRRSITRAMLSGRVRGTQIDQATGRGGRGGVSNCVRNFPPRDFWQRGTWTPAPVYLQMDSARCNWKHHGCPTQPSQSHPPFARAAAPHGSARAQR